MGQILNRFIRVVKSKMNSDNYDYTLRDNSDDELKKIIDELNNNKKINEEKEKYSKNKTRNSYDNASDKKNEMNIDYAFKILNISSNSSIDEVKTAYKQKIKEYHPDRVASLGKELQVLAEQKTQEINECYNLIRKTKGF